jgi:uncharacterized paraquat-inducible protein A
MTHRTTHCVHGHAYTPENSYVDKAGRRFCRACATVRQAAYNHDARSAYPDRTLRPATRVKPKPRRYCEMCDQWFNQRGDCPKCGAPLRTAA